MDQSQEVILVVALFVALLAALFIALVTLVVTLTALFITLVARLALLVTPFALFAPVVGIVDVLAGIRLNLFLLQEVKTLAFNLTVDEGTSETSENFLGLGVIFGLA